MTQDLKRTKGHIRDDFHVSKNNNTGTGKPRKKG
jgi:hypothetical protein